MRSLTRLAGATTAILIGLAGVAFSTGEAVAAPAPTLVGSAPATAHGPNTITFSYAITLPTDVDSAVFTTRQPAALPADPTGVTLDGAAVPAAQVTQPSTIDLAVRTGPAPTDGLTAGTHTITFTAPVSSTGSSSASSTATLSWSVGGVPDSVTSAPVVVEINPPDVSVTLTPNSGEDQVGFLGTGRDLPLAVDVDNHGYGSPDTTMTIDLPVGMALGQDGVSRDSNGDPVACTAGAGRTVVCPLGQLPRGAEDPTLVIDLTTDGTPPVGSTVPVTVSAALNPGEGVDSNPANDSTTAQVLYTGSAKLSTTITPAKSKIVLGQSTTVTLTVHNDGPQKAPETLGFAIIAGSQFEITDFTGKTFPIDGDPVDAAIRKAGLISAPTARPGVAVSVGDAQDGTGVLWSIGDIPVGGTVSAVLTLKAVAVGNSKLGLLAISGAGDPNCDEFNCEPKSIALSVVKPAPVTSSPTPTPSSTAPITTSSGTDGLANTGPSTRPALIGTLLLLVGCALLFAGRRRTLPRHR